MHGSVPLMMMPAGIFAKKEHFRERMSRFCCYYPQRAALFDMCLSEGIEREYTMQLMAHVASSISGP
jgi:hypothetical protein